jgi:hypothetical protein
MRRNAPGRCARAAIGHAAAEPPSIAMIALRHVGPAYDRIGSFASDRLAAGLRGMSASLRLRRNWDASYLAPPAQNRTRSFPAYGSHLGF